MRLLHSLMHAAKCKVADFVVNDALLSSCAHARNRYQMYLMEGKQNKKELKRDRKGKLSWRNDLRKKAKEDIEKIQRS